MQLKKLSILGFKSFADKTPIEFDGGITAIVGPNGCGKSNIVDAFRWVMGEGSAKSIRGDKMLDLIFAGTEKRKPLNIAEVTLTFDNSDGRLPIQYDEVAITRRVYRSGESEYLINKNMVRLKDIESLFWDTGLGKNALCVFEQGKIEQVIQATPMERRAIFEEAAGILRFKERRKEAFRRLELAEQNVLRAQDIHLMVSKQKEQLEKQAKEASLFKLRKSRLEELEKALLHLKWKAAFEKKTSYEKQIQDLHVVIEEKKNVLLALDEKEKENRVLHQDREKKLYALTETLFQEKNQKELKAQTIHSSKEQQKELQKREERLKADLEGLLIKRQKAIEEFGKNTVIPDGTIEQDFKAAQKKVFEEEANITSLKGRQKQIQQERLLLAQNEMRFKGQVQEMRLRLETSQERSSYLKADQERLSKHIQEIAGIEKEKKRLFDELSQEIDLKKKEHKRIDEELTGFEKETRLISDKEKEQQKEINELAAKRKALIGLKQDFEGFSAGSKQLMQGIKLAFPLYERVKADKKYAKALSAYSETLSCKTRADFEKVIEFANQKQIKGFSLFCEEDATNLETHFFEKLESIDDAYYVDHNKVHFFPKPGEKNTFVREAEIESITEKLNVLQIEFDTLQNTLKSLQNKKELGRIAKIDLEKSLRAQEMKLVEINFGLQRALQDKEKALGEQQRASGEMKKLEQIVEEASKGILQWVEKEGSLKKEVDEKAKLFQSIEDELQKLQEKLILLMSEFKAKETLYQQLVESKARYKRLQDVFEATNKEHVEQEKKLKIDIQQILEKMGALEALIKLLSTELTGIEETLKEKESLLKEGKKELESSNAILKQHEQQKKNEEKLYKEIEGKMHKVQLLVAQEDAVLSSIGTVEEISINASQEEMRKEHADLKNALSEMPEVNLAAIEEFEKQKTQEAFLRQQLDDLKNSKEEIIQIIKELDDESRKLFVETFTKIQENFKKNFQLLFEGGEAALTPIENKDLLEAGIEISAKPPGKQMRSITLLSGGEKCLTALALLFAIFEVKPAAFCLLDEVDAPLDEVNVERFSRMLKAFSAKTQFIVITHNKRTMSIADKLHGISMEEKGVSKLLSLVFEPKKEEVLV